MQLAFRHIVLLLIGVSPMALISQSKTAVSPSSHYWIDVAASDEGWLYLLNDRSTLYTYDGISYEQSRNAPKANRIDQAHPLVLLSTDAIHILDRDQWKRYFVGEPILDYIQYQGDQWALSSTGLYIYREGRFTISADWSRPVHAKSKFEIVDDILYMINGKEIYRYDREWRIVTRDTVDLYDLCVHRDRYFIASELGLKELHGLAITASNHDIFTNTRVDELLSSRDRLYIIADSILYIWESRNQHTESITISEGSSFTVDVWDDLWLVENGALQKIEEEQEVVPTVPQVSVIIDGRKFESFPIVINQESADIKISYRSIHLRSGTDMRYQTMLYPLEPSYSAPTRDHSVYYSDLPAGDYTFHLRASVNDSDYQYIDPIKISIKSQTRLSNWWYILLAAFVLLLGVAILANYRLQQYRDKSRLLSDKLRTAQALVASQQKTMQLQMNPHFLFNTLNSIQSLVTLNRSDEAKKYLQRFSRMMRKVLDFSRVETIDLADEVSYLEDYLSIERMTRSDAFDYSIHVDPALLEEGVHIPPMLIQPHVENAIVHGISSITDGQVSISIKDNDHYLTVSIEDNGIGRDQSKMDRKSTHQSISVALTDERLRQYGRNGKGNMQIIDLKDEEHQPSGTRVILTIPI